MSRSSISSSETAAVDQRPRVHPFLVRLIAAAVIAAITIGALGVGFLYATNEMGVFSDDVIEQADHVLWGPGFGQQHAAYKLKRATYTRPDFLILGSSRVTQFRDIMAPKGARFYNASLAASSLGDAHAFLLSLYEHDVPKTVLLGIDPWWFRPGRSGLDPATRVADFSYPALLSTAITSGLTVRVIRSLIDGKMNRVTDPLGNRKPVGYHAALTGNGFRADGSYQYGDILSGDDPQSAIRNVGYDNKFYFYRQEVTAQHGRFTYTGVPDQIERNLLSKIVADAHDRNVTLILFFPPMASAVMDAVNATPAQRAYFAAVKNVVSQVATDAGLEFYDFHDLAALDIDDRQALDGIHVDEIASLAMLTAMARIDPLLASLYGPTKIAEMQALLRHTGSWAGPHRIIP